MSKRLAGMVLAFVIGTIGFSGNVHADFVSDFFKERDLSKFYYGLGVADGSAEVNGADNLTLGSANATLGLNLVDLVGVEFQLGVASDDPQSVLSEAQVFYGAAMLRIGVRYGQVGVYGLLGQALLDTASTISFSRSSEALGIGINLFGNNTTSLNLHFLRLDDGAFTSASIGFQYYFGGYR